MRGVRHLVDDREVAVEAVADQHGVVALHDHARDAVAALTRGAQPRRGVLEILVQHDREHRLGARGAVQLVQPAQPPARRPRPGRRLADRTHDGIAREIELLQPARARRGPVSTGSSSASSRRCTGSPRRRSARATSSLTPAAHAVEPFAPVVAARHTPRKSGGAPASAARRPAPWWSCRRRRPPTSISAIRHAVSPRRTYAPRASRTSAAHRWPSRASSRSASSSSSSALARPGRSDS